MSKRLPSRMFISIVAAALVGAACGDVPKSTNSVGLLIAPGNLTFSERSGQGSFDVSLMSAPGGEVVLQIAADDPGEVRLTPTRMAFTEADWSAPQTVVVTGVEDHEADSVQHVTLSVSVHEDTDAQSPYAALVGAAPEELSMTIADDDVAALVVSSTSIDLREGTSTTFDVALGSEPTGNVELFIVSGDETAATVTPASLVFSPETWFIVQSVTVLAVDNTVADPDRSVDLQIGIQADGTSDTSGYVALADYILVSHVTNDDPRPTMLYNAGTSTGNLGGRSGADSRCVSHKPAGCDGRNKVAAFLSVDYRDVITGLPSRIGISDSAPLVGPMGLQISATWAGLADNAIDRSLASAAVLPSGTKWWSGTITTIAGTLYSARTCFDAAGNPWSSAVGATIFDVGNGGLSDATAAPSWINDFTQTSGGGITTTHYPRCNENNYLLCVCGD